MDYVLIFLALSFISLSQVMQKLAAINASRQQPKRHFLRCIATRKETWWAVISLMIGMLFWLGVLYRMEVSKAFPYLSLGTVLVLLASRYYFHETFGATRWTGVVAIIIGVALLSRP